MPLTDVAIGNAKQGERVAKLSDGGLPFLVMPTGSKLWQLCGGDGRQKQKKLSPGAYPTLVNGPIVRAAKGVRPPRPSEALLDLLDRLSPSLAREDGKLLIDSEGSGVG